MRPLHISHFYLHREGDYLWLVNYTLHLVVLV